MHPAKNNIILKLLSLALSAVLVSCSPRLSNNMLSFFFDGVPPLDTVKTMSGQDNRKENRNPEIFRPVPIVADNNFSLHPPYKEKECFSCHDENAQSELLMPQPDLCYLCHNDFSKEYKFVHGPVAAGYCTSCHNPHKSELKKLLIRPGQQLCLDCHLSKSVFKNKNHKDIGNSECILCHNPHGGENRFILNN